MANPQQVVYNKSNKNVHRLLQVLQQTWTIDEYVVQLVLPLVVQHAYD